MTDHKLYDEESNAAASNDHAVSQGQCNSDQNSSSLQNSTVRRRKAPSYHQHHHPNGLPGASGKNINSEAKPVQVMSYDIEMEEIKVADSFSQQQQALPQSTKNSQQSNSLYLSNKAAYRKQAPSLVAANSSSVLPSTASMDSQQFIQRHDFTTQQHQQDIPQFKHTRGAAAAPINASKPSGKVQQQQQ